MRYALLFVLLAAGAVAGAPVDSAALVEYKLPEEFSAGSATCVACENGKSLMLTAAHVVPDAKGELTVTLSGKKFKAKYLTGSPVKELVLPDGKVIEVVDGVDLALLVVDDKLPPVAIAKEPAKKGDVVHQFGYAGGPPFAADGPHFKQGKVTKPDALWSSADARRGDSGCALLNAKGELVGVVHSRSANNDEPGGLCTPLAEVKKFLAEKAAGFPKLQKEMKK